MHSSDETHLLAFPSDLRIGHADWACLLATDLNVLLEGPQSATATVLRLLEPRMNRPAVEWKRGHALLNLPDLRSGTLMLQDVDALSVEEQNRLARWLCEAEDAPRILATTATSLYSLVTIGRFDAALYYRLNVLLVSVEHRESDTRSATRLTTVACPICGRSMRRTPDRWLGVFDCERCGQFSDFGGESKRAAPGPPPEPGGSSDSADSGS